MKKTIVFTFTSLAFAYTSYCQNINLKPLFEVKLYSKIDSTPLFIKFTGSTSPVIISENISLWFRSNINANNNFQLQKKSKNVDLVGNYHEKYTQYYAQYPVINSMVNIHYKAGKIQSLNGHYFPQLNVDITPQINEENALSLVIGNYANTTEFAWQNTDYENLMKDAHGHSIYPKGKLCVVAENFIHEKENFRLAYQFDIYGARPSFAETVYIDAINGKILHKENLMCEIDVAGTGKSYFGGTKAITCDSISANSFRLQETGNRKIKTYNAMGATPNSQFSAQAHTNTSSTWDLDSLSKARIAIDIHWGLEKTLDFYKNTLKRNSIDNAGMELVGLANYDTDLNNAFWNGRFAAFGNGDGSYMGPLATLDVCGHEISHGLIGHTAGLVYSYESGALNESFADIFGKCIEYSAQRDTFTWKVGNGIKINGGALRDMKDPYLYYQPKYYKGTYYSKSSADYGGVHTNSGVQNHWFYLLCVGGNSTHEKTKKKHIVDSIGWEKATAIAYSNLVNFLTPTSDYSEAALFSIDIAGDMYGYGSMEQNQVILAWYLAGLAELPVSKINNYTVSNHTSLYPNPTANTLTIKALNNYTFDNNISVTDITGKVLFTQTLDNTNTIDVSFLDKGVYLISFTDGSQHKFVKL